MKRVGRRWIVTGLVLVGGLVVGCGDDDPVVPDDAPENHTVLRDGAAHAPGLNEPRQQCASCHGSDLRGGDEGEPSCFTCHGQEWP